MNIAQPEFLARTSLPEPRTSLPWGCAVCDSKDDLKTCTGCRVVSYCSKQHQADDRKEHKQYCNFIKEAEASMKAIDERIGRHPLDDSHPYIARLVRDGRFARDRSVYFPSMFNLSETFERIYTKLSIAKVVKLAKLMMLYYPDNYFSGGIVASHWMRLDEDQDVYGFIKAWTIWEEADEKPESRIMPRPIENPDIMEDVYFFLNVQTRFFDMTDTITFMMCLTFLKVKILLDLKDLQNAREAVGPSVPPEVLDGILTNIPRSSTIRANRQIMESPDLSSEIKRIDAQVNDLYNKIHRTNYFWWRTLVNNPREAVKIAVDRSQMSRMPPESGSPMEAAVWMTQRNQRYAWTETPGMLDFIHEKNKDAYVPSLSETRRVYGKRGDELAVALNVAAALHKPTAA